jgi:acetolactate synthase-1/2/3 large subunit
MKRTVVEWLVDGLRARGVEWIAALCGHGLDPLFDAAERGGLRIIDTRNEQTAAYVAEGYGRLTGRPGVCATSSGVAVANALTGVMNAWYEQAPMLYISGSADLPTLGLGCFQDLDQAALVRPVARYSQLVESPNRIAQMLDEAWHNATPAHLMIPLDVQRAVVAEEDLVRANSERAHPGISSSAVEEIARAVAECRRPLIISSSEVFYSGEKQHLAACAEAFSIPVLTPIWDRGIFDEPSDAFLGVVGAATGGPKLLDQTDCLILAGTVPDYRVGYLQRPVTTFRLVRGWRELHERLADFDCRPFANWLAEARRERNELRGRIEATGRQQKQAGRMHAVDIVEALEECLPAEACLVIDAGSAGQWAHQLLCDRRYPSHWLTCGRSGVVGYGIGGAMAARLAFPNRPVVLLSGDGAFTFTVADLECAERQRLPFVAIVADDRCWGITHSGHLRQFGHGIGTELGHIQFDLLARSLGAEGHLAADTADLAARVRAAIDSARVSVIHVPIVGGNPT